MGDCNDVNTTKLWWYVLEWHSEPRQLDQICNRVFLHHLDVVKAPEGMINQMCAANTAMPNIVTLSDAVFNF